MNLNNIQEITELIKNKEGENIEFKATTGQAPDKYPTSILQLIKIIGEKEYSVKELINLLRLKDRENFLDNYLNPAMKQGLVTALYPDQPKHPKQKYHLTDVGYDLLKHLE